MHRIICAIISLLLLSACATEKTFRDRTAPFSSLALFDPNRFAGQWHQIASHTFDPDCQSPSVAYAFATPDLFNVTHRCGALTENVAQARLVGPGRLMQSLDGKSVEIWVLWVDFDYRTAVLARRDGRGAWILDRSQEISADRFRAAEDVLKFNGYDTTKLRSVTGEAA